MNKHFLEFWGNVLIQAARNQQQMDDFAEWMQKSRGVVEEQMALFKRTAHPEQMPETERSPDGAAGAWKDSFEEFRASYTEMMDLFGMVSKEDYQNLKNRCEELERQLAVQEEVLRKGGLKGAGSDQPDLATGVQDLIQKQGEQFKDLMESLTHFYSRGLSPKRKGGK